MDKTLWAIMAVGLFLIFMASFAFTTTSTTTQGHVIQRYDHSEPDSFQLAIAIVGLGVIIWGITRS